MIDFAPKGAETLRAEITAELEVDYEGNEEMIDKLVARGLKDEEFKASLHADKTKAREKLKEARKNAGLDPETGEKLPVNQGEQKAEVSKKEQILEARALNSLHEDDIEEVVAIAEAKKVSLSEAIKSPYVKAFIQTRAEERKTAEAVTTKPTRSSVKSGETELLKKAENNQLDPSEMKEAAKAMIDEVFGKK